MDIQTVEDVGSAGKTPADITFARDPDGRLIFHTIPQGYEFDLARFYNHRGWVYFENGEATTYGVIWKTRRRRTRLDKRLDMHHQGYLLYSFAPDAGISHPAVFSEEQLEAVIQGWNEGTLTGIKVVPLNKLKLNHYGEASTECRVPLENFYLKSWKPRENAHLFKPQTVLRSREAENVVQLVKDYAVTVRVRQTRKRTTIETMLGIPASSSSQNSNEVAGRCDVPAERSEAALAAQ